MIFETSIDLRHRSPAAAYRLSATAHRPTTSSARKGTAAPAIIRGDATGSNGRLDSHLPDAVGAGEDEHHVLPVGSGNEGGRQVPWRRRSDDLVGAEAHLPKHPFRWRWQRRMRGAAAATAAAAAPS